MATWAPDLIGPVRLELVALSTNCPASTRCEAGSGSN